MENFIFCVVVHPQTAASFSFLHSLPIWHGKNKDCTNDYPFEDRKPQLTTTVHVIFEQ